MTKDLKVQLLEMWYYEIQIFTKTAQVWECLSSLQHHPRCFRDESTRKSFEGGIWAYKGMKFHFIVLNDLPPPVRTSLTGRFSHSKSDVGELIH